MTLSSGQASYRGLVFGEGTDLLVDGLEGLYELEVSTEDRPLALGHGGLPTYHLARGVPLVLKLTLVNDGFGLDGFVERYHEVLEAFTVNPTLEHPLQHRYGHSEHLWWARVVRRQVDYRPGWAADGWVELSVALERVDPRRYDPTEKDLLAGVYDPVGDGVSWPVSWPVDWGDASGQAVTAHNNGNAVAYPLLRVFRPLDSTGTVSGFSVTSDRGEEVVFDVPLTAGQLFVADFWSLVRRYPGPHVHIDGSSRYTLWQQPRRPLGLHPGGNTLRFEVDGTAEDLQASLLWRDASL